MSERPHAAILADGRRLHLRHGPIDLVIEAFGADCEVRAAYRAAVQRFGGLLEALCRELPLLRAPQAVDGAQAYGVVARRMQAAVLPFAASHFITPMAAVAGSVADEVLAAMVADTRLARAYVNNGGDIALHLAEGQRFDIGLVDRPDRPSVFARSAVTSSDDVRGIATSGWRGRSFSLGIADAVTVLARSAAMADAAATIVANAVDLPGHAAIERVAACLLQPDTDLGQRPVTRGVGALARHEIERALASGAECAAHLARTGLIHAAALHLAGVTQLVPASSALSCAGSLFSNHSEAA